jgi:diguanylate cyclase (GGDEF)-like protein/PAS domain S-box-containing protein
MVSEVGNPIATEHRPARPTEDGSDAHAVLPDEIPVALAEVDGTGVITAANARWGELVGADVVGESLVDLLHPEDVSRITEALRAPRNADNTISIEGRLRHRDGRLRWVRAHARLELGDDGRVCKALIGCIDVTQEVENRQVSARLNEVLESIEDVVAITDLDGQLLHLNLAGRILLDDEEAPFDGIRLADLFTPESAAEITNVALSTAVHFGSWTGEVMIMQPGFEPRVVSLSLVSHIDEDSEVVYLSAMTRDITDLKAAEDALRRQATTDSLTGLPNRATLFDRLGHALSRSARTGGGVALLFVDLDRFKAVNDELGHEAGDELLVQVGQRLLAAVRHCDTVARLGGDEFVVLAEPIVRLEDARFVADRIVRTLSEPFELNAGTGRIGASVGLVVSERDSTPNSLLKQADAAVYRAKAEGRSRVVVGET